jgi:hypothetical protein
VLADLTQRRPGGKKRNVLEALDKIAAAHGVPIFESLQQACQDILEAGEGCAISNPGKLATKEARRKFRENDALNSIVQQWQAKEISGQQADERAIAAGLKLSGMQIAPLKLTEPIFTHFIERPLDKPRADLRFYEDDEMVIFPNNKGHSRSSEGAAAAMSYVHLLIIPKRRIYNAVSLQLSDLPLLRSMQQRATAALKTRMVLDYYLKERDFDLSEAAIDPRFLEFYVHLHPKHSVGHLHIHAVLVNLWTANGELMMHKNTRLADVIAVLREEEHDFHEIPAPGAKSTAYTNPILEGVHLDGPVPTGGDARPSLQMGVV